MIKSAIKNFDLKYLLFVLVVGVAVVLFYRCPVRLIFGIECPSCGMTRAFLSALRLDFKAAFSYHPLFLLFMFETAYVVCRRFIRRFINVPDKLELVVGIISLILLLIVWIIRQFII